jgi:hypothetical protein
MTHAVGRTAGVGAVDRSILCLRVDVLMAQSGKRIALLSTTMGAMVVFAATFLCRKSLVEHYYIFKLKSLDEETRLVAVDRLGGAKSLAAIPHLIRILKEEKREKASAWTRSRSGRGRSAATYGFSLTPIAYAIYRIGERALPAIERTMKEQAEFAKAHRRYPRDPEVTHILFSIKEAWEFPQSEVRRVTY